MLADLLDIVIRAEAVIMIGKTWVKLETTPTNAKPVA
jgi:hypothetical protein